MSRGEKSMGDVQPREELTVSNDTHSSNHAWGEGHLVGGRQVTSAVRGCQ